MQRFWPYIFCLFFIGAIGLYIGHASRSEEISLLKQLIMYMPYTVEKNVIVYNVDPQVTDQEVAENSAALDLKDHMKQIAHVHVPQVSQESRVSKPSLNDAQHENDEHEKLATAYKQHLEHACTVLRAINHKEKTVRIFARLELGDLRVAGPLCKYMQELINSLLVRYCDDAGKLQHSDSDEHVVADVEKAVALLEQELAVTSIAVAVDALERVDFTQVQRRVQRHAYNGALKKMFSKAA
ncbi:MAG: hypothetical protein AB7F19_00720 [Candidatus Babeliales bacterium]